MLLRNKTRVSDPVFETRFAHNLYFNLVTLKNNIED